MRLYAAVRGLAGRTAKRRDVVCHIILTVFIIGNWISLLTWWLVRWVSCMGNQINPDTCLLYS